jgi:hypothetical protein
MHVGGHILVVKVWIEPDPRKADSVRQMINDLEISILVFSMVTPFGLIGRYLSSASNPEGGISVIPTRCWYLLTSPYNVITQETNIDIFAAVRTSDLERYCKT